MSPYEVINVSTIMDKLPKLQRRYASLLIGSISKELALKVKKKVITREERSLRMKLEAINIAEALLRPDPPPQDPLAVAYYADANRARKWVLTHLSEPNTFKPQATYLVKEVKRRIDEGEIQTQDLQAEVLEIGFGGGRDFSHLSGKRGLTYIGIDASPEMVKLARIFHPEAEADLREGNVFSMNFPPDSFAAVWMTAVLHHVLPGSMEEALHNVRYVMTDNGLLFLSVRSGNGNLQIDEQSGVEFTPMYDTDTQLMYFAPSGKSLQDLLDRTGFKISQDMLPTNNRTTPRGIHYLDVFADAVPNPQI